MKYKIEFELPDNETVLKEIKATPVSWSVWGFSGWSWPTPVTESKTQLSTEDTTLDTTFDCISRRAAIDAADRADYTGLAVEDVKKVTDEVVKELKQLPSAQQEVIQCKDCKHRGERPIADGRYWCDIHNAFMYYCSDAERRTDE